MDEQHFEESDERLVRKALLAAYPPTRSQFSQRRGAQIVRAAALEHLNVAPSAGSRVAACVAASLVLLAGTTSAASAALPGQPLYPLKRMVERAMVAVTSNDGDAARLELRFAERRLREASAVGSEQAVAGTLADRFNEHINAANALAGDEISGEIEQLQHTQTRRHADPAREGSLTAGPAGARPGGEALPATPTPAPSTSASPSPAPLPSESASPSPSPSPPPSTEAPAPLKPIVEALDGVSPLRDGDR